MEASPTYSPSLLLLLLLLLISSPSSALLSPQGVNYEVQVLMAIKNLLKDPNGVLKNWDKDSVDPCSWNAVTCSPDKFVTALEAPNQSLSGMLSPSIGNLTIFKLLLQNNNINGPVPAEIGKLAKLQKLNLSSNHLYGEIPSSVAHLKSLQCLDLSYNNLSGPIPRLFFGTLYVVGNPIICSANQGQDCSRLHQLQFPTTRRSHSIVGNNPRICTANKEQDCNKTVVRRRK